jgi:hypothetical protein
LVSPRFGLVRHLALFGTFVRCLVHLALFPLLGSPRFVPLVLVLLEDNSTAGLLRLAKPASLFHLNVVHSFKTIVAAMALLPFARFRLIVARWQIHYAGLWIWDCVNPGYI